MRLCYVYIYIPIVYQLMDTFNLRIIIGLRFSNLSFLAMLLGWSTITNCVFILLGLYECLTTFWLIIMYFLKINIILK